MAEKRTALLLSLVTGGEEGRGLGTRMGPNWGRGPNELNAQKWKQSSGSTWVSNHLSGVREH